MNKQDKANYQRLWYARNRERVLATRRQKYAFATNWQERAAARKNSSKVQNAKLKAKYRVMIDTLKSKPCLDCNQTFPPECMDFDHVRGKKLFGIGMMGQRREASVLDEIAKCDLVCSNCHRIRTRARQLAAHTPEHYKYIHSAAHSEQNVV